MVRRDRSVGRAPEGCCGRSERLGRIDAVLVLADFGTRDHCTAAALSTAGDYTVLRLGEGWAAAEYERPRSRETALWVAAAAFDANVVVHRMDPSVAVWEHLDLVRPCI